jgi:two-component system LytT family response regulator
MKCLIVEDEPLARLELRRLLAAHPACRIVGEAASVEEAAETIRVLAPDLLFLDIQIAGGTGFDLLDRLGRVPQVIFTTAYDQFALQAFRVNALDYLLKPIAADQLAQALARARLTAPREERLFIRDGDRCWLVEPANVRLFESEGNYTRCHFGEHRPLLLKSLNQLEERLDPACFFRVSRQHIVNLDAIELVKEDQVLLRGGMAVPLSRRRARDFRALATRRHPPRSP